MQTIVRILLQFSLFFVTISSVHAKHIIGGDIQYEYLGGNTFRFTMKIYRDCSDQSAAVFDQRAAVTIFSHINGIYTMVRNIGVPISGNIISIDPNLANPCLVVPPNVCVQEATYIFTETLPMINGSYTIAYQRCCRNNTINNIRNPNSSGATFTTEITSEALRIHNNSPAFAHFPPVAICANEPLHFDHSATDVEGDSIIYEFCSPLLGGGLAGSGGGGNPNGPNGTTPDPASPPPYANVAFLTPTYSPST